jgi:tRNA threonylcarbamoyladenosine biosynthesis protein TsaE
MSDPLATICFATRSPEATEALGEALGRLLAAGDLLALHGALGAGKTCLVRGLARGLRVRGRVASPSFIVARFHPGPVPLYHADAYRLASASDLVDAGLDEWLTSAAVAVEWAERVVEALPADRLDLRFELAPHGRRIEVSASGARSLVLLEGLRSAYPGDRDIDLAIEPCPRA